MAYVPSPSENCTWVSLEVDWDVLRFSSLHQPAFKPAQTNPTKSSTRVNQSCGAHVRKPSESKPPSLSVPGSSQASGRGDRPENISHFPAHCRGSFSTASSRPSSISLLKRPTSGEDPAALTCCGSRIAVSCWMGRPLMRNDRSPFTPYFHQTCCMYLIETVDVIVKEAESQFRANGNKVWFLFRCKWPSQWVNWVAVKQKWMM